MKKSNLKGKDLKFLRNGGENDDEDINDDIDLNDNDNDNNNNNDNDDDDYYYEDGDENDDGNDEDESKNNSSEMKKLRDELKKELKNMSLGEIEKLRRSGFNGMSLHEAVGFKSIKEFFSWLSSNDEEDDNDEGNDNKVKYDDSSDVDDDDITNNKKSGNNKLVTSNKRLNDNQIRELEKKIRLENASRKKKKDAPRVESSVRRVKRDIVRKSFSSGLLVPPKRELLNPTFEKSRDPRFDGVSTEHAPIRNDLVEKNYSFLFERREEETKELDQKIKNSRNAMYRLKSAELNEDERNELKKDLLDKDKLRELQAELTRSQQKKAIYEREKLAKSALSEHMKKERKLVAEGVKSPFFLKKRERQKIILEKQFEKLESEGNLDRVLEKRRKKNSQKDRRLLPTMKQ